MTERSGRELLKYMLQELSTEIQAKRKMRELPPYFLLSW